MLCKMTQKIIIFQIDVSGAFVKFWRWPKDIWEIESSLKINKTPCFVRDGDNRMNTNGNSVLSIEWINYYNEGVFYLRGITFRPCTISQSPRSWLSQCQEGLGSWRILEHGFDLSSILAFEAPQIYFSLWSAQFYHSPASSKSDAIDYRCRDAVS